MCGEQPSLPARANNPYALTGFVLGCLSVFFSFIGLVPILGIVFSSIGLGTFDQGRHHNRWMAGVGLGLSILYTFVYLREYGHIRFD